MRAVNLIPSDQRGGGSVGAGRSGGAAYAVLALLLGFAVLAIAYGKASRTVSSDQSKAAALTAQAAQDKAAAEALAPYTSFVSLRKQRESAVTELVDTRFDWAHAFHELGRVLNNQSSISSLSGEIGATEAAAPAAATPPASSSSTAPSATGASATTTGAVSSATPAGSIPTFTLTGCGSSQKAVAQMLQRLRLIDGVKEVTLQSSTKSGSGSSASAGGSCPSSAPVFSATITFEPLPSASEAASAAGAKTVADTSPASPSTTAPPSTPPSTTAPGGSAR
jgi:HAMP domain-containing protein